jgi:WD40-like Beta Propeller Repeat
MDRRCLALVPILAATAAAAPARIVDTTGVRLAAPPVAAAFCDGSARAVFLLRNGDVVAIDDRGALATLHSTGLMPGEVAMTCDASDRIAIAGAGKLVELDGATVTSRVGPQHVRDARLLDDGTAAFVDWKGTVWRWNGSALTSWTFKPAVTYPGRFEISGDGNSIATVVRSQAVVYRADGTTDTGPTALGVVWDRDGRSLLVGQISGLGRWVAGDPADRVEVVDRTLIGSRMIREHDRIIAIQPSRLDIRTLDRAGQVTGDVTISRVPSAPKLVAVGRAPFAVIGGLDSAWIANLTSSNDLVERHHPKDPVFAMAFSPDGKSLAFIAGDDEVVVASIDRRGLRVQEPPDKTMLVKRVGWPASGTLVAAGTNGIVRWSRDGKRRTDPTDRILGMTPAGETIELTPSMRVIVRRASPITLDAIFDFHKPPAEADVAGQLLALSSLKNVSIWNLAGGTDVPIVTFDTTHWISHPVLVGARPAVMFATARDLYAVDASGEHLVERLPSLIGAVAVRDDRQRVAVGCSDGTIVIFDAAGHRVGAPLKSSGQITALAWSPDGSRLAVAVMRSIEVWTPPK